MANKATIRAYTSPTLVLLAMDWSDGAQHDDFLGFAILRSPGFHKGEKDGYLLNKIGFAPPGPHAQPLPSNVAPIHKFLWWDSTISDSERGTTFSYTVTPVRGTGPQDLNLVDDAASDPTQVEVPNVEREGISTWFNRAVVSSQAFSQKFPDPEKSLDAVMDWLANGLEDAFTDILKGARNIWGAIYHLTDEEWVMPDLTKFPGNLSLVYEDRTNDTTKLPAIKNLEEAKGDKFEGEKRSKTNIMHNKFLVDEDNGRVLMGSANYTPEGFTSQANLLHIFDSRKLADLFIARQKLIAKDPSVPDTAKESGWSDEITVGRAKVRVFFSPEPTKERVSIDTVVDSINTARESVIFCMFDPTDRSSSRYSPWATRKSCSTECSTRSPPRRKRTTCRIPAKRRAIPRQRRKSK